MKVKIIKGTNQIGGCITEITCNKTKIIIDYGEDLEDNNIPFELDGLTKGKSIYNAVFITHSHSDHIGLIDLINEDIPVYVEEKSLEIHNLTCDFTNKQRVIRKINKFEIKNTNEEDRVIFQNEDIKVSSYIGDHSSFNSVMYLVEGEGKKILHTGDFRMHGRRKYAFLESLNKVGKVDLLITEGTTLTRGNNRFKTEDKLQEEATNVMKKYNQVLVIQSSTNVDRLVSFEKAGLKTKHKIVFDLLSRYVIKSSNLPIVVDNKTIFTWIPLKYKYKPEWFKEEYMNIEKSSKFFPNYVMFVKESMIRDIKLLKEKSSLKNACLIYSMWNGYIEKSESLRKFLDECNNMGITILNIHTSGHADKTAMRRVNKICNPDKTIIIHTDDKTSGLDIFNNVIDLKDNENIDI